MLLLLLSLWQSFTSTVQKLYIATSSLSLKQQIAFFLMYSLPKGLTVNPSFRRLISWGRTALKLLSQVAACGVVVVLALLFVAVFIGFCWLFLFGNDELTLNISVALSLMVVEDVTSKFVGVLCTLSLCAACDFYARQQQQPADEAEVAAVSLEAGRQRGGSSATLISWQCRNRRGPCAAASPQGASAMPWDLRLRFRPLHKSVPCEA